MKLLTLLVSFLYLLRPTVAGPANHAVQQLLFYYAYLADEYANDASHYTIAPGCGAAKGVARCNFNQFLEYIWAPGPQPDGGGHAPTVTVQRAGEDFSSKSLTTWQARLMQWKDPAVVAPNKPKTVIGNTNSQLLVSGATDFYDALSKVGRPIGQAEAKLYTEPDATLKGSKAYIVNNGRTLATWLYQLRFADMEKYRIPNVRASLAAAGFTLQTKAGATTIPGQAAWQRIDAAATAGGNANARTALQNSVRAYVTGGVQARAHYAALMSAKQAGISAACVL